LSFACTKHWHGRCPHFFWSIGVIVLLLYQSSFPKVRQDSVYSQYQAFASRKLVRIDRPAESAPAVTEITPEHEATETPFFVKVSVCAQRRWSKMSDSSFLGTSRKKELPCRLDFTQLGSPSCSAGSFMARI
jgi:hypothetical protein